MNNRNRKTLVVGNHWSAVGAAGLGVLADDSVVWITGSEDRLFPPLPSLSEGDGAQVLFRLIEGFQLDLPLPERGNFLRELHGKGFREPLWTKALKEEEGREIQKSYLWGPELKVASMSEVRFLKDLAWIEDGLRRKVSESEGLTMIEEVPLVEVQRGDPSLVILADGKQIEFDRLIYAGQLTHLKDIKGLPRELKMGKGLVSTSNLKRNLRPMAAVQLVLNHRYRVAEEVLEGFMLTPNKDAGETFDRRVWGYFSNDGERSIWTYLITSEDSEDNRTIVKKIRRIKQVLNKAFGGETWVPKGCKNFTDNVVSEQVKYIESAFFEKEEEFSNLLTCENLIFLTDGFGFSSAMSALNKLFFQSTRTKSENKAVDLTSVEV